MLSFWINVTYNLISLIVYIVLNALIFSFRKEFSSSYYKLFMLSSFVNICIILDGYVSLKIPAVTCRNCLFAPIYAMGTFWGFERVSIMGISSLGRGQYIMSVLLTANRFTAVITPLKYERFWSRLILPFCFLVIVVPILSSIEQLIYPAYWYYNNQTDSFSQRTESDAARRMLLTIGTISISCFLNVLLNLITVYLLFAKQRSMSSRKWATEARLLVHSLVNFVAEMAGTVLMLIAYFATNPAIVDHVYSFLLPWASDALTLLSPYILVFCSASLRARILRTVFRRKNTSMVILTSHHST